MIKLHNWPFLGYTRPSSSNHFLLIDVSSLHLSYLSRGMPQGVESLLKYGAVRAERPSVKGVCHWGSNYARNNLKCLKKTCPHQCSYQG